MSIYTEQERDKLIGTPIVEVLAHFGKDCRDRGKGMFLSPLRDETDPSFHVSFKSNTWYDFGMGIGGGVIDLVCRLSGCERKDALDTLSIINGRYPDVTREFQTTRRTSAKESAINIIRIEQRFVSRSLIRYAASRGIPVNILNCQCQEVTFSYSFNESLRISAIGFMKVLGGYSLRNSKTKKSSSSVISTITIPDSGSVRVFEGFFDYLSYLAYNGIESPDKSVCVLNGVGNLLHALSILEQYKEIYLYLDNDTAGKKTAETIIGHCSVCDQNCDTVCNVHDMSHLYHAHKDFNSMLVEMISKNNLPSNTKDNGNHSFKGCPAEIGQDQLG